MATEDPEDEGVTIYLERSDALKVADFLDLYGEDDEIEIAASIRYQATKRS